jgi:4-amino-4-deoxy-L-arabinose transferase-like glycosyltransferase
MKNILIPVFLTALILGLILRGYQFKERFLYAHDNDLAGWIVKDIIVDHHLRLIGQETSAKGIFIGPLFYYSLIPFYLITGMDPIGSRIYSLIIGLAAICSLYFVVDVFYGRRPAGIASLIYAVSFLISQTEREVVPTTTVMLWSIWFYYSVNLIFRAKKSGLDLAAFLLGLVWHINLALILLSPLVILGVFINHKKFLFKDYFKPIAILIIMSLPLFIFEIRHNFLQTKSLIGTVFENSAVSGTPAVAFSDKVSHVVSFAFKNATRIFFVPEFNFPENIIPVFLTIMLLVLIITRKIPGYTLTIFILWMGLYILFFTLHPINLSEYYLNGMNIFWLIISAVFLGKIMPKFVSAAVLCFLIFYNLNMFLSSPINASGYLSKKALINFIYSDAAKHNYPCVALSYITNPGYQFGYRYFTYLQGLKTAPVSAGVPVYSVVFPHSLVDRIDNSFGAIGLVLPEYTRYDQDKVKAGCSGENSNLTDPMFGFTK